MAVKDSEERPDIRRGGTVMLMVGGWRDGWRRDMRGSLKGGGWDLGPDWVSAKSFCVLAKPST